MDEKAQNIYYQIAERIDFVKEKTKLKYSDILKAIDFRSADYKKLFNDWAGISPQTFFEGISTEHIYNLLNEKENSLFNSNSYKDYDYQNKLHNPQIIIERMAFSEGEITKKNQIIHYSFSDSLFGNVIIASTSKGVCYIAFTEDKAKALYDIKQKFPNNVFYKKEDGFQENALSFLQKNKKQSSSITLHLKGTDFQIQAWKALLEIPIGQLLTYGELSKKIGNPNASRAVGTAIGSNPIAYLIPCHRVIKFSGSFGGYRWGNTRKTIIIGWEMAQVKT